MRQYDDPVEVRRGLGDEAEGPEQFLWRGRLWKVRAVVAHWVETGPWWQAAGVRAALGDGSAGPQVGTLDAGLDTGALLTRPDPFAERDVWRVEASRGLAAAQAARAGGGDDLGGDLGFGVFDLTFDGGTGCWQLTRCLD